MDKNEMIELSKTALDNAYELCKREEGWNVDTAGSDLSIDWRPGDNLGIKVMENGGDWRAWRVKAEIEGTVDMVYNIVMDVDNIASWNSSLTQSKVLEKLDDVTQLTYQVTSGQRPIVNHRDFVFLFRKETRGEERLAGGCSVDTDLKPPCKEYTRAWQFPGLMIVAPAAAEKDDSGSTDKCVFTWLQQSQYGGMMPVNILNAVFPIAMKMFVNSLKAEVKRQKKKEKKQKS
eukprot:TRINITY_DN3991_c1_g1_i1.p1 TRINITY_DN3991_c1_g1~~TRINITY_DN3991_c1_g1_i1.p1  ORF type:complete len:251 (+),score=73.12 TRINITY_DN3991_c1_g1_i1:59-754(+)